MVRTTMVKAGAGGERFAPEQKLVCYLEILSSKETKITTGQKIFLNVKEELGWPLVNRLVSKTGMVMKPDLTSLVLCFLFINPNMLKLSLSR